MRDDPVIDHVADQLSQLGLGTYRTNELIEWVFVYRTKNQPSEILLDKRGGFGYRRVG
jgi:hypothetical protein